MKKNKTTTEDIKNKIAYQKGYNDGYTEGMNKFLETLAKKEQLKTKPESLIVNPRPDFNTRVANVAKGLD